MPDERVLGLKDPLVRACALRSVIVYRRSRKTEIGEKRQGEMTHVVLVGEDEQAAGHPADLEGVEGGEPFGDGQAVVELAVDDELRGGPVADAGRWVPARVRVPRLPQRAPHIVHHEEQLLRRPVRHRAEDPVVAHQRPELAA